MKKYVSLILAVAMILTLAACGGSSSSSGQSASGGSAAQSGSVDLLARVRRRHSPRPKSPPPLLRKI